jgi:hypothetical protein
VLCPRAFAPAEGKNIIAADTNVMAQKKPGQKYLLDISATRLSL